MPCVSIGARSVAECLAQLHGVRLAEIRLDRIAPAELTPRNIARLFAGPCQCIATCRPGAFSEARRQRILLAAIAAGAAYIDLEVDADDAYKDALLRAARRRKCRVIISSHDTVRTPPLEELRQIVDWCFASGADIAKIACRARSPRDNVRLMGLLDSDRPLIVVGMGPRGAITRVVAPLLGSRFTFAAVSPRDATAPGQMAHAPLTRMMQSLQRFCRCAGRGTAPRNIALIGFMGSGKDACAHALAAQSGMPVIHIDDEIEARAGRSIPKIFSRDGEATFRALEAKALERALRKKGAIINCGGGAILRAANRAALRRHAFVVWLYADLPTTLKRIKVQRSRPLLNVRDRKGTVARLLAERLPLYAATADLMIHSDRDTPAQIAERIYDAIHHTLSHRG